MRQADIAEPLGQLAFSFFYTYSRFEFALNENGWLRNDDPGSAAAPDWRKFSGERGAEYFISDEARALVDAAPKRQVVAAHDPRNGGKWT